ncbi:hypothetical protein K1T71_011679 [Dendrolimus kikuchii]|uniref:Uncharacterized protein n=1 Tax=Dendrolimus kikuchii TaxID=765133 RepID=A0ACC1CM07_9NEOP|nr:hypothetical protein K1T71_011679 [Dendrolimus kikuchii]
MPQNKKCYFGCFIDGPLHNFPKPQWHNVEKFRSWKFVLSEETQALADDVLKNQVRFCYRHFESFYQLPSKRLTANAIPTLNLSHRKNQCLKEKKEEHVKKTYKNKTKTIKEDKRKIIVIELD